MLPELVNFKPNYLVGRFDIHTVHLWGVNKVPKSSILCQLDGVKIPVHCAFVFF